jgi:hypothetical protein
LEQINGSGIGLCGTRYFYLFIYLFIYLQHNGHKHDSEAYNEFNPVPGILKVGNGKLAGNTAFVARLGRKYSSGLEPWTLFYKTGKQWPISFKV